MFADDAFSIFHGERIFWRRIDLIKSPNQSVTSFSLGGSFSQTRREQICDDARKEKKNDFPRTSC